MSNLSNKTILITGAASGIGKLMARLSLERGARVVIWDINQTGIDATVAEFSPLGEVFGFRVDVAEPEEIRAAGTSVRGEVGTVDIIINNAGIVVGKDFLEHSGADITRTLNINTAAPMLVTREFLGDMVENGFGHVCNIASAGALISNPKMSVYAASKWALLGWSDSLRLEMKERKTGVGVTTILPYYINTGMFDGVKSRLPILEPEPTAAAIIRAIEGDKKIVTFPGYMYRVSRLGQSLLSVNAFDWFAGSVLGIHKTMQDFRGRS